jgi:NhaA family Na+:H+ antiporter
MVGKLDLFGNLSQFSAYAHWPFFGYFEFKASLKHLINDGLMVIFFFLLGLEIKREVLVGDLAEPENRRMLIFCALGGMIFPALIYSLFNWSLDSQVG